MNLVDITGCRWALPVIIGNSAGSLLPSSESGMIFGVISALVRIVALIGLWMRRKWGMIATFVVVALNLLLEVPAIAAASTALIELPAVASVLACAAIN